MDILEKKKQLDEFSKKLKEMSVEELHSLEKEIIKEADEVDKETSNTEFDLPKENYKEVASSIQMLLNKQTVEWRFTLGLVSMYEFWDPENFKGKIQYPMLDATLRTLGDMQFTGYKEWAAVVVVNKYFEPLHNQYVEVTEKTYDVAAKHNAVMDELKLREPLADDIPDAIDVQ